MTRILSALVFLPVVIGIVWLLPPWGTLALASVVLVLGVREYFPLVEHDGEPLPRVLVTVATLGAAVSLGAGGPVEAPLLAAMVVLGSVAVGADHPGPEVARRVALSVLPVLYLGLPIGSLVAVRWQWGAGALFALLFSVIVSDTAQYYGGRTFGRRPLAPEISPKKTLEGAISGSLAGTIALPALGAWWLPSQPAWGLALLGATLVALGIAGDLFESLLKRSAGVKDTSALIPGHGGILDRVDSLLFAGPVYYLFLTYGAR